MKKTLTANISGTVFHIEEDAYDQLQRYLANIRAKFSGSTGSEEIMADIEARIAELFSERLQGRQVVTIADVDHVKGIMGQPEDFEGAAEDASSSGAGANTPPPGFTGPRNKRLYRDTEDKWVGGVIGGLAAYFHFDPLWLRIAFAVFLVLGWGVPLVVYCVMWVLVPKADTPAEKLAMRGEPVTVDNIKRVFDEGMERAKTGARRVADEAQEMSEKWRSGAYRSSYAQRPPSSAEHFARGALQVVGKIVGAFLLVLGAAFAFCLITAVAGGASLGWFDLNVHGGEPFRGLINAWLVSSGMEGWAWAGILVVFLVPILGLILAGVRLLVGVHVPRWLGWTLVPVWIASVVLLSVLGIRQAHEFRQRERITDTIEVPMPADRILHIATLSDPWFGNDHGRHSDDLDLISFENNEVHWGWAELDVQESPDSLFHLEVVRRASGISFKEASARAQDIRYTYELKDGTLSLSPAYTTTRDSKLRGQLVSYIVRVPLGAAVRFERGTARIINDIDNTTDTYDGDMVGRTWTMTPAGLEAGTPTEVRNEAPTPKPGVKVDVHESKDGKPTSVHIEIPTKEAHLPSLIGLLRSGLEV